MQKNVVTKTFSTRRSSTGVVKRIGKMLHQTLLENLLSNSE